MSEYHIFEERHNNSSSTGIEKLMRENGGKIEKLQELIRKKQNNLFYNSKKDKELLQKIKNENLKFNTAYDMKKVEEENIRKAHVKQYAQEEARKERERKERERKKQEELDKQVRENYRYLTKDNLIDDPNAENKPGYITFTFIEEKYNDRYSSKLTHEFPLIDGGVSIGQIKKFMLTQYGLMFKNIEIFSNVKQYRLYRYWSVVRNTHFDNINDETKLMIDPSLHDHLMECPSKFAIMIRLYDLGKVYGDSLSGVDIRFGKELLHIQNQVNDLTKEFQEFKDEMLSMMKQIKDSIVM